MMLTSDNTDEQDEEDLWALLSFTFIWTLRTPNDLALQLPDLLVSHTLWIWTCCLCFPVLQGNPPLPVPLSYSGVSSRLRCHFFQEKFVYPEIGHCALHMVSAPMPHTVL